MLRRFSTLFPYLKANRRMLTMGAVMLVLANYMDIKVLILLGQSADILGWSLGPLPELHMSILLFALGAVLTVTLTGAVARFWMRRLIIGVSREIEFSLRNDFFRRLQQQSASFFQRHSTGDIMARSTNDMEAVRLVLGPAIMYLASVAVMLPLSLYQMIRISPRLTLITWLPLLMIAPLFYFFTRRIHERFLRVQEKFSEISTRVQEALSGIRVIKAYAREEDEAGRFDKLSREYVHHNLRLALLQAFFIPLMAFMVGLSLLALVGGGGYMIIRGEGAIYGVTPGNLISFFLLMMANIWPMAAVGWVFSLLERGAASLSRIDNMMQAEPEVVEPENVRVPERVRAHVEIRNLTFAYPGAESPALHDIDLEIRAGQTLGLTGPVGCGKSTLAMLLARRYNPPRGTIFVDGIDILDWPLEFYRRQVSIVDQEPFVFSESIRENIGYGLNGSRDDGVIERASEISKLSKDLESFPHGLETMLGERGINVSGGQRQRLALARALAPDPKLLILDDALAAVDTHTEEEILSELHEFMQGRTTILISHRVRTVSLADEILYLEDGRIVERGTHEALIRSGGRYWELAHKQQLAEEIEATA